MTREELREELKEVTPIWPLVITEGQDQIHFEVCQFDVLVDTELALREAEARAKEAESNAWKNKQYAETMRAMAEKAEGALRQIAQIVHTGGLDELTEADALVKVRGLSMLWWDIEETNRRQQENP